MSTNQYTKEFTEKYNAKERIEHPHQFMAYSTWLEEIGDIKGKRVLDLACGSGISSRMLAERGAIVTGVDMSESMIDRALEEEKKNPQGINYMIADASIPVKYGDKPFDLVVAAFLLHYADTPSLLEGFIKNISLNLKVSGEFVSINMSPDHPIVLPAKNVSHSSRWLGEEYKDGSALEILLWSQDSKQICNITDYHWSKKTYESLFRKYSLNNITWVELRMHEKGKKLQDWKKIEKQNMLVIIRATRDK